jgi:aryl-alcohol dehydrogenase-like predicted oxidoreductase
MEFRQFGRTDLKVSAVGFGSANVPETLIAHMMGGNAARQFAVQPLRETAT